jgi:hypothetical protein
MRKEGGKWRIEAKDEVGWQRILNEAKAHLGLAVVPIMMMVNVCVRKSLQFVPVLNQMNPAHTLIL